MKAKTMLGLIACAGACVSLSAFGTNDDWFAVSASGTTATLTNVSTNMGVEVTGGKLVIDTDDTPLRFTPDASVTTTNRSDGVVTIAASAALTPNSVSDFDSVAVTDAKVGIAVGVDGNVTNYYGYAAAGWKVLTGDAVSVPDSGDTSFKLILDYRTRTAKFYIGEKLMTYGADTPTTTPSFATGTDTLLDIAAYGSGSISSIDTDFEIAEVAIGGVKYGSVADALAAGGTMAEIKSVDASGSISENATAANGLPMAVCVAAGVSVTDPAAVIATVPVDEDTNESNVTLKMAATGEPGVVVNFAVKQGGEAVPNSPFPANAILVPCATGIYTVEPVSVTAAP